MTVIIVAIHIVVAVFLILTVLLQAGKGADLAGAFGGAGSETAFGSRGTATLLSKLSTASAVLFMLTSLGLAVMSLQQNSLIKDEPEKVTEPAAETVIPGDENSGTATGGETKAPTEIDTTGSAEQTPDIEQPAETDETAEKQPSDTNE